MLLLVHSRACVGLPVLRTQWLKTSILSSRASDCIAVCIASTRLSSSKYPTHHHCPHPLLPRCTPTAYSWGTHIMAHTAHCCLTTEQTAALGRVTPLTPRSSPTWQPGVGKGYLPNVICYKSLIISLFFFFFFLETRDMLHWLSIIAFL